MVQTDTSALLTRALEDAAHTRNSRVITGAVFSTFVRDLGRELETDALAHPEQSFKDFLLDHPQAVWVIPRKRQDILVAHPAAAGEVARKVAPALLRHDLYEAFTDLDESHRYVYDAKADEARRSNDSHPLVPPSPPLYSIPQNTEVAEITIRTAFAEVGDIEADVAEALRSSLTQTKPLTAFAAVARERNVAKAWHDFKFARLLHRINEWAVMERIPWQSGWIQSDEPTAEGAPAPATTKAIEGIERALGSLSEADLARIMVPLDIVARLLADRGDTR